jgi:hypothetical protein
MTRKAFFSEGCALRVRIARPDASPGYGMITEERTNGRWPNREMLRSSASLSRGRAEPAPPRGAKVGERPCGEKPGIMRRGGFLEGARSPRPHGKASRMAKGFINGQGWARNRWLNGEMPRSNPSHPRGPEETPFRKGSSRLVKIYGRNHLSDKLVPSQLTWQSPS